MSRDSVESAFPSDRFGNLGMSLRDYFAGQALAGHGMNRDGWDEVLGKGMTYRIAVDCYAIADAMIAQRDKPTHWTPILEDSESGERGR